MNSVIYLISGIIIILFKLAKQKKI